MLNTNDENVNEKWFVSRESWKGIAWCAAIALAGALATSAVALFATY